MAPWAAIEAIEVGVRRIDCARLEGLFEAVERADPVSCRRSGAVLNGAGRHGAFEQGCDGGRGDCDTGNVGRRLHLVSGAVCAVCEPEFCDRLLKAHVAAAEKTARERVAAHVQEVEDEDCEPEIVVVGRPHDAAKRLPLKFRRREGWDADVAEESLSVRFELEGIAIDDADGGFVGDEHAAMVDVSDDAFGLMYRGEGARRVGGGSNQKSPIGVRKLRFPAARTVQVVDVFVSADARQYDAGERAGLSVQEIKRPSRQSQEIGVGDRQHRGDLHALVRLGRVVDFGHLVGAAGNFEDRRLAAFTDQLAERNRPLGRAYGERRAHVSGRFRRGRGVPTRSEDQCLVVVGALADLG